MGWVLVLGLPHSESVALYEKVQGANHQDAQYVRWRCGSFLRDRGRHEEAAPFLSFRVGGVSLF